MGMVIGIGEVLWDMLPAGARLGGAPANFTILSARLGSSSMLVSCLGDDALGQDAMSWLTAAQQHLENSGTGARLDLSAVQRSSALPTGVVDVLVDRAGVARYRIAEPSAWDDLRWVPDLAESLPRAAAICFGTLSQRAAVARGTVRNLIEQAGPDCLRVCDLNLRPPYALADVVQWSVTHCDLLKVSEEEIGETLRLLQLDDAAEPTRWQTDTLAEAAAKLLRAAPRCRLLAVTRGPLGSALFTPHQAQWHPGFPADVVDTVGAGDAFLAGLVHAFRKTGDLAVLNEVANLCGSFVASRGGATPELSPELLERIGDLLPTGSS